MSYRVMRVEKSEFDTDPRRYIRMSGPELQVIVSDSSGVHFAFGGEIAEPMEPDPRTRTLRDVTTKTSRIP